MDSPKVELSSHEAYTILASDLASHVATLRSPHSLARSCARHIGRVPTTLALPPCVALVLVAVVLRLAAGRGDASDGLDATCAALVAALVVASCALGARDEMRETTRTAERLREHLRPFVAALAAVAADAPLAAQRRCLPLGLVGVPVLRDGVWHQLPPALLVRGDHVALLSPGDDARELFGMEYESGAPLTEAVPWSAPPNAATDDGAAELPSAFGEPASGVKDAAHLRALGAAKHVLLRTPACVRLGDQLRATTSRAHSSPLARAVQAWWTRWALGAAALGSALCLAAGAARCALALSASIGGAAPAWDFDPWREVLLRPTAVALALLSPALPLLLGAWRACALSRLLRALNREESADGGAPRDGERSAWCCAGAAPALGASPLLPSPSFVEALGSITFMCCADGGVLCDPVPIVEEVCVVEGVHADELVILDLHIFPQLRDVASAARRNNRVEFEDPHWRDHLASLKPVGLASLLHASAAPALAECMNELAHAIGFVKLDSKIFSPKRSVALRDACCTVYEDVRFKKQMRRVMRRQQRRGKRRLSELAPSSVAFSPTAAPSESMASTPASRDDSTEAPSTPLLGPAPPHAAVVVAAAAAVAAGAGDAGATGVQQSLVGELSPFVLFMRGDAEFVLKCCTHTWTGTQPLPLTDKVAEELRSYCAQLRREDHTAIALAYGPLSSEIVDFDAVGELTLLGLVAYRGLPRNGVQTLISESMRSGIRFAYFSPRRYRECRPLAAKMGLHTGWNCAVALNKPTDETQSKPTGDGSEEEEEEEQVSYVERPESAAALSEIMEQWVHPSAAEAAEEEEEEEEEEEGKQQQLGDDAVEGEGSEGDGADEADAAEVGAADVVDTKHAVVVMFTSTTDEPPATDGADDVASAEFFEGIAAELHETVHFVAVAMDADAEFASAFSVAQTPAYYFYTLSDKGGVVERVCLTSFVGHNCSRLRSNSEALRTMCAGLAVQQPSDAGQDDAGAVPWMEHSRLPECVEEIRDHITDVDNVPLLVSLFTNVSPQPTREMIAIMQENEEVVCVVGSSSAAVEQMGSRRFVANSENAGRRSVVDIGHCLAFDQADIAIARASELSPSVASSNAPSSLEEIARRGSDGAAELAASRLAAAALQLSARLNTLTCAIELQHSSNARLLVDLAREARQISFNLHQAFALVVVSQLTVALLLVLSAVLALPSPIAVDGVLWLLCVQVPIIATSHVSVAPRAGLSDLMPVKSNGSLRSVAGTIMWGAVRVLPIVIALLLLWIVALSQAVIVPGVGESSVDIAGFTVSDSTVEIFKLWGLPTSANYAVRDALRSSVGLAAARSFMLCALLLVSIALSVGGLGGQQRTQSLMQSLPHHNAAWLRAVLIALVLQLAHWLLSAVIHSTTTGTALLRALFGEAPYWWWSYALFVALLIIPALIVASEELHKLRERKRERLAQMQRRQTFDCRLGMFSPQ